MKKELWLVLMSAFLALPCTGMAGEAETEDDAVLVDDMIVTASRSEQANEKVAAQVTVITAEDIRAGGAQSVPDALKNLGGVVVSDLWGNGLRQTVDMGGFGETAQQHVAVLVDGRKLNPIDQSGISYLNIPIENVEKIEVFHGGNSVLYGASAMGGVINIITKEAKSGVHAWAEGGAGSYGTAKGNAGVSFSSGKFGGSIGGAFYDTDGYRDQSAFSRRSGNARFTFDPSDILSFAFDTTMATADYEYPNALTLAQMEENRKQANSYYPDDGGESHDNAYVFSIKSDLKEFGRINLDLSYRDYNRSDISYGSQCDYDYNTFGVNPQYVLDHAIWGKDNRLTLGMEYYDTDYDASYYGSSYDNNQSFIGFFIQDEFNVLQNLILNIGTRYEDVDTSLKGTANKDVDEDEWAWNIGLSYIFMPRSKVYIRAYQAYRFPLVDEYVTYGVFNTNLTHETSQGYEIGTRFVGLDNRLGIDLRLFLFDVDDEIAYNNISYLNENLEETRHQGGEVNIDYQVSGLVLLFGGVGYTDAKMTAGPYDGKNIPLVPELKAHLGFELKFDFGLNFRCQYNHLGERYAGSDNENDYDKLDSADTVDLYLSYPYEGMEFFINANNIFNEKYYTGYHTAWGETYYPVAEAVYFAGVRVRF